jgi:addiction module HigA family antidote
MAKKLDPIHPGEVLLEEFLGPLGIAQYRLAHAISVPPQRINEIVHGNRAISADNALRLARFFGTGAQLWLNLEARYDLETERDRLGARLTSDVKIFAGPVQYWRGH